MYQYSESLSQKLVTNTFPKAIHARERRKLLRRASNDNPRRKQRRRRRDNSSPSSPSSLARVLRKNAPPVVVRRVRRSFFQNEENRREEFNIIVIGEEKSPGPPARRRQIRVARTLPPPIRLKLPTVVFGEVDHKRFRQRVHLESFIRGRVDWRVWLRDGRWESVRV